MSKDKDILDIRNMTYENQIDSLQKHYAKAYQIWKNYDHVDPRLKETFLVLSDALADYKVLLETKCKENSGD